jgi:hypothetical protein
VLVRADAPELRLVHDWSDSWSGIGLIVVGMSHQGFTVSLGEHGVGRWIAVVFHGRGGHELVSDRDPARADHHAVKGDPDRVRQDAGGDGAAEATAGLKGGRLVNESLD